MVIQNEICYNESNTNGGDTMNENKDKYVPVRMTIPEYDRLKSIANESTGRNVSRLIRIAIDLLLTVKGL